MKSKEVIEFFGGPYATGKALGISGQAVSKWTEDVPSNRVKHVELAMKVEAERRKRQEGRQRRKAQED